MDVYPLNEYQMEMCVQGGLCTENMGEIKKGGVMSNKTKKSESQKKRVEKASFIFNKSNFKRLSYYLIIMVFFMEGVATMRADESRRLKLFLPDKIDAVVGDTLEIFYEGLTSAANPLNYNIVTVANKGRSYRRKWAYTPLPGDKNFPLCIQYYDDFGKLVGRAESTIMVSDKATTPSKNVNILSIGASTTASGRWVAELQRRLCGTGGTPEGLDLSNITFIGSCGVPPVCVEAYGGWSWREYIGSSKGAKPNAWVYITSGMKVDDASQHSIWKDTNGNKWQLETIDKMRKRLKFKPYTSSEEKRIRLPVSGTLTWLSGGKDIVDIRYTGMQMERGNSFWSLSKNAMSFHDYLERNKIKGGIDLCLIFLGGNDINGRSGQRSRTLFGADTTKIMQRAKTFINALHKEFPKCGIVIMSLFLPDANGFGENYGCKTPVSSVYSLKNAVIDLSLAYQTLANSPEYSSFVDHVNLGCQFDIRNGVKVQNRFASVRSKTKEKICINAMHPSNDGYKMIADAVYRNVTACLNRKREHLKDKEIP
jgi:lysophospholipase L1-like esterase